MQNIRRPKGWVDGGGAVFSQQTCKRNSTLSQILKGILNDEKSIFISEECCFSLILYHRVMGLWD